MLNYLLRRLFYAIPILLGVMVITFVLFFVVQKPESMARRDLGQKASQQAIDNWLHQRGWDKPRFINRNSGASFFDSQFFNLMKRLATFDLGESYRTGERISDMFRRGAVPSLLITVPAFFAALFLSLGFSLILVLARESLLDRWGAVICVATMSLPITVYIVLVQWVVGQKLAYFPAFGFYMSGLSTVRFLLLPILVWIVADIGAEVRLYRAIFLEEIRQDYVRTGQAKGLSPFRILFIHVLKNGMISLITLLVAALPGLIMGSLVLENFFGIPGLGNLTIDAVRTQDFPVVWSAVYLGSILYLVGLILTDICYAIADPRIRLK